MLHRFIIGASALLSTAAWSQSPVDQADPSVVVEELTKEEATAPSGDTPSAAAPVVRDTAASELPIIAGAIRIEGAEALPPSAFAPIIERYAGRTLSPRELTALAGEIAAAARAAGYGLASAWIPAQRLANGILVVRLDEGRIDAVQAEGDGSEIVERYLAPLIGRDPVLTRDLERQLLLAGDVGGLAIGRPRLDRIDGQSVLRLRTSRDRVAGYGSADNWGSDTSGPIRVQLSADVHGLLSSNGTLSVGGFTTPFEPRELLLGRLGYATPLGTGGTSISVQGYFAATEAGGALRDFGYEGRSADAEVEIRHALVRSREASLWAYAGAGIRDSEQDREELPLRRDRVTSTWLSAYGIRRWESSWARGRIKLIKGLDLLDATRESDPLSSRRDGSGVFTKLEAFGEFQQKLGKQVTLQLKAEGQLASRPLLSSEEMGLGGRSFLRGYDYREFSGDRGVAGAMELKYDLAKAPKPLSYVQLYAYADAGTVDNLRDGRGGGSLASAGGGVRTGLGRRLHGSIELGVPLSDGYRGRDRDPRLSFTLQTTF
jgi:hemolysin activation/secretion protein